MAEAKNRRCRLGLASSDGRFPAEFYGVSPEGLTFSLMSLGGSSYIGPGGNVNRGEEFRWKIVDTEKLNLTQTVQQCAEIIGAIDTEKPLRLLDGRPVPG